MIKNDVKITKFYVNIFLSSVQWVQNQGQCGVCGDAFHLNEPRPHEAGGEYAKGTIVRHYTVGQVICIHCITEQIIEYMSINR